VTVPSGRPRIARVDWTFPWYIGVSLLLAIAGGFTLALLLPLAAAAGWDWGLRWPPLAQAHGHLQVAGWVGLFVLGMAFRLMPRFAGRPLRFASVTPAVLVLILAGLLGRTAAQPWLDTPGMHLLLACSTLAELAGALLFAAIVFATVAPAIRTLPVAPLFLLGALGFAVQAALGALWLSDLTPALPIVPGERDGVLLGLQFYAFLLPFVLAVSLRSLPAFFKWRTARAAETWLLAGLLAAGSLCYAGPALLGSGLEGERIQQIGALSIAAAMIGAFVEAGIWRQPLGLRPSARHSVLLLRTAYIWMALAACLLAWSGARALLTGDPVSSYAQDAIRHMLALGLFSTLIAGMAQLVLPWLAQRRQRPGSAAAETLLLWSLFTLAAILRVSGALLAGAGAGGGRYWLIAASGMAGITAVIVLGLTILRAARQGPAAIILRDVTPA
jgi:uncharacterized protein involved in response to NO